MQLISEQYRELNKKLHEQTDNYGRFGYRHLDNIFNLACKYDTRDILDYGCGKGTLSHNLPFPIKQYDPAILKHSELPEPADIVVCTDVLEHVEPEFLDEVIKHLEKLTKKAAYFCIGLYKARKTLDDGRNAHLIQESKEFWVDKLKDKFDIEDTHEEKEEVIFILKAKERKC